MPQVVAVLSPPLSAGVGPFSVIYAQRPRISVVNLIFPWKFVVKQLLIPSKGAGSYAQILGAQICALFSSIVAVFSRL